MNYLSRREHVTSPHNPLLKEIRRAAARGGLTLSLIHIFIRIR